MSYMCESERIDEDDARSWGARVVQAFNNYNRAQNAEQKEIAYGYIKELVKEMRDLGYDFSYVDPYGVAGFKQEDMDLMKRMKKQLEKQNDGEER